MPAPPHVEELSVSVSPAVSQSQSQSQSHGETVSISSVSVSSAPWVTEGVSKATWYRQRAKANLTEVAATFPGLPPSAVIPQKELPIAPEPVTAPPEAVATKAEPQSADPSDTAADAFLAQIEAHREAERLQRYMQTPEGQRLRENPVMVDRPDVLHFAHNAVAQAGIERGSPEFLSAMKAVFEEAMKPQAPQASEPAAEQATPAFFQPPAPPAPEPPDRGSVVSAPVTRMVPGSKPAEIDPRRVTLSAIEQQIARSAGISDAEYARQKLKMQRAKATGEIQ